MISCPGLGGIDALACVSQQTSYIPGYILLILAVALLYFRLEREPTRERFASIMLFVAVLTAMGAIQEMLFPTGWFIVSTVLALGALFMLTARK